MPSKLLVARRGGGNQYPLTAPPGGPGAQAGPGPTYPDITGFINVKNAPYNAAGNGSTNDTTAIQNALNAAASAAPYGVYFPAGTYMISATLIYTNNHKLVGADPATTTIRNLTTRPESNTAMLYPSGAGVGPLLVHSLNWDTRSDFYDGPGGHSPSSGCTDFSSTHDATIENCHWHNARTIAISSHTLFSQPACTNMRVQYCHIFNVNGGGISVFGDMNGVDFHYNLLENGMDDAIALQDYSDGGYPTNIRVTNNTILNFNNQSTSGLPGTTPRGILAFGADQMVIDHNTITNTFRSNIEATIGNPRRPTYITISNNICTGAGSLNPNTGTPNYGIFLLQADHILGSGNVITGSQGVPYLVQSCTDVAGTLP